MILSVAHTSVLAAAIDRLIPADDFPSATQAGGMRFLQELFNGDSASKAEQLLAGLDGLADESQLRHGREFAELADAEKDALLRDVEDGALRAQWTTAPQPFFELLLNVTAEGYYADTAHGRVPASWEMIGYDPGANRP